MCYKGIIFDMDGVIVDTNLLHYKAWSIVANKLGLNTYTYEDNEKERGAGRREGVKRLMHLAGKDLTEKEIDDMEELKNEVFFENLEKVKKEEIVFNDVEYTLKELDKKGIKKSIRFI